jgi:putative DNA primase/helicase
MQFIGKGNASAMSLQRLESDRFAVAALYGKLANICADLPSNKLKETSTFKAITGGDPLTGEYKFRDSFTFCPFCKLLFSANRMPLSPDDSNAFFRRWLVIRFIRVFREGAPGTLPQRVLLERMTTPGELSGLLNLALVAGDGLRDRGHFTRSDSMAEAAREFRRTTDPFHVWLDEHTVLVPKGFVVQKDLYKGYGEECRRAERAMPSPNEITAMIQRIHPGVKLKQKRVNRKRAWCYCGIGWLTSESSNE